MSDTLVITTANAASYINKDGHLTINQKFTSVTIRVNAFMDNQQLKTVKFSTNLNSLKIDSSAFQNCPNLAEILFNLPEAATTTIYGEAFKGCTALEYIEIPYGVKNLPMGLFSGCSFLQKVIIPSSVNCIANDTFKNCHTDLELAFHDRPTETVESLKMKFNLDEDQDFSIYQSFAYNGQTESFCLKQKEDQAKLVSFQVVTSNNKQSIQPTNGNESLYAIIAPFFSDLSNDPDNATTTQPQYHTVQFGLDNKNKMVISLNRMHIDQPTYPMSTKPTPKHSHQVLFIYPISDTLRITLSDKIHSTKLPHFTTKPNENDLLVFANFQHQNIFSYINAILLEKNESSGKIKMIELDGDCKNPFESKLISLDNKKLISLKSSHNQHDFPKIRFKDFFKKTVASLKTEYPAVNEHNCSQYFNYYLNEDSFGSSVFEYSDDDDITFVTSRGKLIPSSTRHNNPYDALTEVIKKSNVMQNTSITDASWSFTKTNNARLLLVPLDHFSDWEFCELNPILDLKNNDSIHRLSTLEDFQMKAADYEVNTQFFAVDVFLKLLLEITSPHMNGEPIKNLKTILALNVIDEKLINKIKTNLESKGFIDTQLQQIFTLPKERKDNIRKGRHTRHMSTHIKINHAPTNIPKQGRAKQSNAIAEQSTTTMTATSGQGTDKLSPGLELIEAYFKLNGERIDPKTEPMSFMHILHAIRKFFKNLFGESLESKCLKAFRALFNDSQDNDIDNLTLKDIKNTHDQVLSDYNAVPGHEVKHPSFDRLFKKFQIMSTNETQATTDNSLITQKLDM